MFKEDCRVLENRSVAPGHFVLKFASKKIAASAKPGQFVQVLCGGDSWDPLLGRPFSFLSASSADFSLLYHVVGKGTGLMAKFKKGDAVPVLGPFGNGFTLKRRNQTAVLVGGGVGIPPLYHLVRTFLKNRNYGKKDIHVMLGARNRSLLLCENDFRRLGVALSVATDDGSKGSKGLVTSLLPFTLRATPSASIFACGPTPMLKAVSLVAGEFAVPNEVSVEVPMACGFGACLGCAIKIREQRTENRGQKFRYAIACTEGPVFQGTSILWD